MIKIATWNDCEFVIENSVDIDHGNIWVNVAGGTVMLHPHELDIVIVALQKAKEILEKKEKIKND